METAVWGLLGTLVGALASIGTSWLTANSTSQREREKLRSEKNEIAHAFQRQTLIDLQDAIHDALRLIHQVHLEDKKSQTKGGEWGKTVLLDSLSENLRVTQRKVAILIERVADDKLRNELKLLMEQVGEVLFSATEQDARATLTRLTVNAVETLEKLGVNLRLQY